MIAYKENNEKERLIVVLNFCFVVSTLLASPVTNALTFVGAGEVLDIDQNTVSDSYGVVNGGVLNTSGADTFQISVSNDSALNMNGGSVTDLFGASAVSLVNSRGSISGVRLTSNRVALSLSRLTSSTTASRAVVTDSTLIGGLSGMELSGGSVAELTRTHVTGTAANSNGVTSFGGELRAVGGTITGQVSGIWLRVDVANLGGGHLLSLSGTQVQGVTGPAILVDSGATETIELSNSATLLAGNGILLDVQGASTAGMTVANSTLQGNVQLTGNSTANLTFDQGRMTGDVLVENGSTANVTLNNQSQFTGRLDNVNGVNLNSQSNWTLTGNDSIGALAMNGGVVSFGAADVPTFYQLNVASLSGNGTFAMKGDFATGERDVLNVTGLATGDFGLAVRASGVDAASRQPLTLVQTAAGDAHFALVNGPVDVGAFSYELASITDGTGATQWFLDPTTKTISPGAQSVMALFSAAPTVWTSELTSLRSRMGELRFNGGQPGAWMRTYGNKVNIADGAGVGYQQTQQGLSLGADTRLGDSQWLVGVLAGYSQSDLDVNRGTSGTIKSYYLGPYVTWLDADTGYYFDGVLKFNRFRNEAKVSLSDGSRSKGDYDNLGVGASAEFGRHIKLADGYFVEPFTQWSAVVVQGRDYDLDNGMQADGDRARSMLGKVGATAGRNIPLNGGGVVQPYVRAAMVHEFAKNNEVRVNGNRFDNDLSGSRAEFGLGVAVSLSEQWQVHADFDYGKGEHIEQPWGANVGVRFVW